MMNEDTMTEDRTEEIEEQPSIDPGDLVAALTERWSWQSDEEHAERVELARSRRNRKAEAYVTLARTVVENDLPWPNVDSWIYNRPEGTVVVAKYRVEDIDTFRLIARAVRRAVGGMQTKSNEDGSLTATVFSGGVTWDVLLSPEVSPCEQVQVGTETKVVREEISPPRYHEVEREEPVYEWRCPDSVLDPDLLAEVAEEVADIDDLAAAVEDEAPATVEG